MALGDKNDKGKELALKGCRAHVAKIVKDCTSVLEAGLLAARNDAEKAAARNAYKRCMKHALKILRKNNELANKTLGPV